jgi:riboflavin synthase
MFTGLIEKVGKMSDKRISGGAGTLVVALEESFDNLKYGESIAVDGACLTLEKEEKGRLVFHVLEETLKRTTLGALPPGAPVNLERAMPADGRFGGHVVTGHVDAVGMISYFEKRGSDWELCIETPEDINRYLVEKGSVAIDGVSLTVTKVFENRFTVRIIPLTLKETALWSKRRGGSVNLEADIIGKYVFRQLNFAGGQSLTASSALDKGLDFDRLKDAGW